MMITENNYEEYFLLYIDNELTDAERKAVKAFVQQHPEYEVVLSLLLQAKLPKDEVVPFYNKNALYKNAGKEIGIDNYEDYFLLYTDNELSEADRKNTERFVLQHPQLQPAFTLLQQTKLPVEKIEFPGKKNLYKKEKKRRVLPLYIMRLSIAAAVLFIVVSGWFLLPSHTDNSRLVAVKDNHTEKQSPKAIQPIMIRNKNLPDTQYLIVSQTATNRKNKKLPLVANRVRNQKKTDDIVRLQPAIHNEIVMPEPTKQEKPEEAIPDENKQATQTAATLKPLEEISEDPINTQTTLSVSDDNNIAKPAVYKVLNTDDDNHTLYVGAFQLNKNKVNGFLKSASRLLGGRSKQNNE